jgi:hypothetical protein
MHAWAWEAASKAKREGQLWPRQPKWCATGHTRSEHDEAVRLALALLGDEAGRLDDAVGRAERRQLSLTARRRQAREEDFRRKEGEDESAAVHSEGRRGKRRYCTCLRWDDRLGLGMRGSADDSRVARR